MDSEYDRKFAEMKQYVPFLERMITRLENATVTSGNPRQAQLDKIKALKNLLLNKNKRMKMQNLLKCEQVLLNLYHKVEQKDCLPPETSTTSKAISDLETARNKLMSKKNSSERMPADKIESVSSGKQTPTLFQRRPNKCSKSPSVSPSKTVRASNSNRNYTRVLASPEPSESQGWSAIRADAENVLYSRRSPRRRSSSQRRSSPHNKKDTKKLSRRSKSRNRRNLNITLKVPEESLFSLNTEDILPRIINCNSKDVDIDALRDMRNQILAELKQTGLNEDISDLILKSYKNKKDKKKVSTKKEEVEEGELSDSESEAIDTIYNSVIVLENDKNKDKIQIMDNTTGDKVKQPRKIQICLVINSDKDKSSIEDTKTQVSDFSEFEMYNDSLHEDAIVTNVTKTNKMSIENEIKHIKTPCIKKNTSDDKVDLNNKIDLEEEKNNEVCSTKNKSGVDLVQNEREKLTRSDMNKKGECIPRNTQNVNSVLLLQSEIGQEKNDVKDETFSPNFYKPLSDHVTTKLCSDKTDVIKNTEISKDNQSKCNNEILLTEPQKLDSEPPKNTCQESVDIPFLNNEPIPPSTEEKKSNVPRQIDILLALTDQLLNDSNVLPGTENTTQSSIHVPKVTKVTNATEILPKKRISIEKYKEKVTSSPRHKPSLFENDIFTKEDNFKKQSLKLTLKECERFSFINKLGLDDSSDEEDLQNYNITSIDEIYDDLAPKSPDTLPSEDKTIPIIIPTDPVKPLNTMAPKNDIDMRCLPILSPIGVGHTSLVNVNNTGECREIKHNQIQNKICNDNVRLVDPRIRKEFDQQHMNENNIEGGQFVGKASVLNNIPRVRSFEVSPRTTSESNDHSNSPVTSTLALLKPDNRDGLLANERKCNLNLDEKLESPKWDLRDPRMNSCGANFNFSERNRSEILDCPPTPSHYFGRADCPPATPTPSFGRLEPPPALLSPFVRSECPPTPNHPFGMSDGPSPINPIYGLSDCPSTPVNIFGWSEPPSTPNHPFGMSDGSSTSSHSFGRSNNTHNQPFLSQKYSTPGPQDPRLKRNFEDAYYKKGEDGYKNRNTSNYRRQYLNPEVYRNYRRDSIGSDRDDSGKDRWRESSTGRRMSKEYDSDRFNSRERRHSRYESDSRNNRAEDQHNFKTRYELHREQSISRTYPENNFYRNNRASSVGRTLREEQPNNNKCFVKSHAGRSFTINTSVNTTFQEEGFDSRRQRASSVGRFLSREPNEEKMLRKQPIHGVCKEKVKANSFQRAKSVGRDVLDLKSVKSLKDLKADFEAFRNKLNRSHEDQLKNKEISYHSRQDFCGVQRKRETDDYKYGTRKNSRDPRIRQDYKGDDRYKYTKYRGRHDSYNKSKHPMVYSSDNIAKGTIFGAGYGVKNYKIPKIKRPIEETKDILDNKDDDGKKSLKDKEQKQDKTNRKTKDAENSIVSDTSKPRNDVKEKLESIKKDCSKSESASMKSTINKEKKLDDKNMNDLININTKTNVSEEKSQIEVDRTKKELTKSRKKCSMFNSDTLGLETTVKSEKQVKNINDSEESSEKFKANILSSDKTKDQKLLKPSLNDLDVFSDNNDLIVMSNNINDLIQHLENDLDTLKPTHSDVSATEDKLKNTISSNGENVMLNIKNVEVVTENINYISQNTRKTDKTEKSLHVQNENPVLMKNDISQLKEENQDRSIENKISLNPNRTFEETRNVVSEVNSPVEQKSNSENTVIKYETEVAPVPDSTINNENQKMNNRKQQNINENQTLSDENIVDKENVNEKQNYMVDNITSTHNNVENTRDNTVLSEPLKKQPDSIESLLSILQNKTKIKELLSVLGDQSNEKIKKKLEKLSEIVSDEEDNTVEEENKVESTTIGDENNSDVLCTENEENLNVIEKPAEEQQNSEDAKKGYFGSKENNELDSQIQENLSAKSGIQNEQVEDLPEKKAIARAKGGKYKKINSKRNKSQTLQKAKSKAKTSVTKRPPRTTEVMKLQQDTKEMFVKGENPNTIGIRLCRLAKLDVKKDDINTNEDSTKLPDEQASVKKQSKKKPGPKPKKKIHDKPVENEVMNTTSETATAKYTPGPKSKTMLLKKSDPYAFECDSGSDINATKGSDIVESDSDDDFVASALSVNSTNHVEPKVKSRRRRSAWQTGVIKTKGKKKKTDTKEKEEKSYLVEDTLPISQFKNPDTCCFTDKSYCFLKNVVMYTCRLCGFRGAEIVNHYKKDHPHCEIPLSRMDAEVAKEAIEQCEDPNFHLASKISTEKYVCRFCFKEFSKRKNLLEQFFWHIVSKHTGEYKQLCPECINVNRCPFNLDIPPPPKDNDKGQLIGFICGKCYFTQLSLENLKSHVIVRHNDEQTEVFTINLASMSKKKMMDMVKRAETPRVLRSSRSNQSLVEHTDDKSYVTETSDRTSETESGGVLDTGSSLISRRPRRLNQLKFETDDSTCGLSNISESNTNKISDIGTETNDTQTKNDNFNNQADITVDTPIDETQENVVSADIMNCAHFQIRYTTGGTKEYICCINGINNHYKTGLLISMKKHIQTKHSEKWDGYCFVCKVIVTDQGLHNFRECFQHFLDKHIDDFPVLSDDNAIPLQTEAQTRTVNTAKETESPDPRFGFINVRPFSELMSKPLENIAIDLPKIQSVVSLSPAIEDNFYTLEASTEIRKETKYEEIQAVVMANKHSVVLQNMIKADKLVRIFKCAGRYCSFTTDFAEEALLHASQHQLIGGTDALNCAYCDFDSSGNAIDLVSHVFKDHGPCPYICGLCFYRSVSTQLVAAHFYAKHKGKKISILMSSLGTPLNSVQPTLLTRKDAVSYYVCDQGTQDTNSCIFRTYISQKLVDHLSQRHCNDTSFKCYICKTTTNSTTELIKHLSFHDLNLYQCASCVFGAPNEGALLAHAASKHPDRVPQAYIRIVHDKDGAEKVVPLAKIVKNNSMGVYTVSPSEIKENPTREAERSMQLEKLIGHIHTESVNANVTCEAEMNSNEVESLQPALEITELPIKNEPTTAFNENSATVFTNQESSPLNTTDSSLVICLDSDEEESKENITLIAPIEGENTSHKPVVEATTIAPESSVTPQEGYLRATLHATPISARPSTSLNSPQPVEVGNLANDENVKKVTLYQLFKCSMCTKNNRNIERFREHLNECRTSSPGANISCAHCSYTCTDTNDLCQHYLQHLLGDRYECGICKYPSRKNNVTIRSVKKHMKQAHGITSFSVCISKDNDISKFTLRPSDPEPSIRPKRKLSASSLPKTPEKKRYGPLDVDSLPTKPILDEEVFCTLCEFHTKVRHNMVRHLQLHAEQQPVPETAPINPVPHLQTNEKHFDKMLNLASSSLASRLNDKLKMDSSSLELIRPEAVSFYPKFVDERNRFTCGAIGCIYTSASEDLLRSHWLTLHSNTTDYRCVHCSPNQSLDPSKPLTITRILGHLKMHDSLLYACSVCTYYHYKDHMINKHIAENHDGGKLLIVRGEGSVANQQASVAPTMDLKPWQCGLCKFKSMFRPDIVDHCAKVHQSKMQYKCFYCPYRTSVQEYIDKHQATSHRDKPLETFYFYYKEGLIPNQPDGTPRWVMQAKKHFPIKTESGPVETPSTSIRNEPIKTVPTVDLNIVKKEAPEVSVELSVKDLCEKYGDFGEPNGISFKCPMCKVVTEYTKEAMQSHLYEELNYRKWGCGICFYKAYHKQGLMEHASTEHLGQKVTHITLPEDINVETYVARILQHQERIIFERKEKLAKQKTQPERTPAVTSAVDVNKPKAIENTTYSDDELINAFGQFGSSNADNYCCPKCKMQFKTAPDMQNHLENELSQIRWYCNSCCEKFQTYHEAQFHCRSSHELGTAKPEGAIRDPSVRAAWVEACLRIQKEQRSQQHAPQSSQQDSATDHSGDSTTEESLLMVRYEKAVPVPEAVVLQPRETLPRKRLAPDSDDEDLYIDVVNSERSKPKKSRSFDCTYCNFTAKNLQWLKRHIYVHYNLRPLKCHYCEFNGYRQTVATHLMKSHPALPQKIDKTPLPNTPPTNLTVQNYRNSKASKLQEEDSTVCLKCLDSFTLDESETHTHAGIAPDFASRGEVVMKCSICSDLFKNITTLTAHSQRCHKQEISYTYFKIGAVKSYNYVCKYCNKLFNHINDIRLHHNAQHSSNEFVFDAICGDRSNENPKWVGSESLPHSRKCARKSTTKLPKDHAVAKKSTTKLPFSENCDSQEEYSHYGKRPRHLQDYSNVTIELPFLDKMVSLSVDKVSEMLNISPIVAIKDLNKSDALS